MKRNILRTIVLSFSLVAAIYIANKLPAYLKKTIGTDTNDSILISVVVLIIIIVLIAVSNWLSYKIKRWRGKNRPNDE